jgi:nicotinamidase/pyrazinamidase
LRAAAFKAMKRALVIVDVQNDFCPGGALPVPDGDAVVPIINELSQSEYFDLVVATQDWHPQNHLSFASQRAGKNVGEVIELNDKPQVLWPDHCVQNSPGANLRADLSTQRVAHVFQKGQQREVDSYSGFFDNDHQFSTGMGEYLKSENVDGVFVCGLATDYCVKYSALDAKALGFKTFLIEDAARGVNLNAGDVENAIEEMRAAGVEIVQSEDIIDMKPSA